MAQATASFAPQSATFEDLQVLQDWNTLLEAIDAVSALAEPGGVDRETRSFDE